MKHIVQFSGGAASAVVAWLVAQKYGKEHTVLLFHDTKAEHPDAARFRQQVSEYIGVLITERSDGRTLREVILDNHCMPNHFIPFCTRILKLDPAEKYLKELTEPFILYNGLGQEEIGRVQRSIVRGEVKGHVIRCLLAERNISNTEVKRIIRDEWKICLPEPYKYLEHNNCIPCYKAGKGHFYKVWRYYPAQFAEAMELEEIIGHTVFKNESLAELAAYWRKTENVQFDFAEDAIPCMCADG